MLLHTTPVPGERKLEGGGFTFYYMSYDDPKNPHRSSGIEDDIARDVAEEFVQMCDKSPLRGGAQIVEMHHTGGIRHDVKHGSPYFHIKKKGSMKTVFIITN